MIKKTSTVTGYREAVEKNVQRARDMGFTGTPEELGALFTKYMTEKMRRCLGQILSIKQSSRTGATTCKRWRGSFKPGLIRTDNAGQCFSSYYEKAG